jgi:hypothetical protein
MQTWRRLKPTPTDNNERLGRGPEGPHHPNSHPQAAGQFATEARWPLYFEFALFNF